MLTPDLPVLIGESQQGTRGLLIIGCALLVTVIGWTVLTIVQKRKERRR